MHNIVDNLARVRASVKQSTLRSGRSKDAVAILAVSKTKPAAMLRAAFDAGQRDFGENYLQEALQKQDKLSDLAVTWHFIGAVQSNKTRDIAEHFAWVHTVERLKIAERLNKQRPSGMPPLNICIQVNIGDEASKAGCAPEDTLGLVEACSKLPHISVRGLMTLPKREDGSKPFKQLRHLKNQINTELGMTMDTLSMGMSADMEGAIEEGATIVRIGTALFGPRFATGRV